MTERITADHANLKRVCEPAAANDGTRILIDRLWLRGVKKADATIDQWVKDTAPSTALRKWFDHDPARWTGFRRRYAAKVYHNREQLSHLWDLAKHGRTALVFVAHDEIHNDAVALRDFLLGRQLKPKVETAPLAA